MTVFQEASLLRAQLIEPKYERRRQQEDAGATGLKADMERDAIIDKDMDFASSFQGADWAAAFVKRNPCIDEGVMLAWFCNAIMRGHDEGFAKGSKIGYDDGMILGGAMGRASGYKDGFNKGRALEASDVKKRGQPPSFISKDTRDLIGAVAMAIIILGALFLFH